MLNSNPDPALAAKQLGLCSPRRVTTRCTCDCGRSMAPGDDFCSSHCEDIARREDNDRVEDALGQR